MQSSSVLEIVLGFEPGQRGQADHRQVDAGGKHQHHDGKKRCASYPVMME
jgi:hypothetical protein